jgi:hypothetical protein
MVGSLRELTGCLYYFREAESSTGAPISNEERLHTERAELARRYLEPEGVTVPRGVRFIVRGSA